MFNILIGVAIGIALDHFVPGIWKWAINKFDELKG